MFVYVCFINIKFWGKKHLAIQSIAKLVKSDMFFLCWVSPCLSG